MDNKDEPRRPVIAIDVVASALNSFPERFASVIGAVAARPITLRDRWRGLLPSDAIILHWPTLMMGDDRRVFAIIQLAIYAFARRVFGTRLIWVAHNALPHGSDGRRNRTTQRFVDRLDAIVYLSEISREIAHETYRINAATTEVVTVHGAYDHGLDPVAFVPPDDNDPVRLLNFGLVRPYKNIEELISAVALSDAARLAVKIVGKRVDLAYARSLERLAADYHAVTLELRDEPLGEAELESAIDNAHGVVLPYGRVLNSGAAIHALSRGRPVLVPALGSMPELRSQIGSDWVQLYEGALDADAIDTFADHIRTLPRNALPDLAALSWKRVEHDMAPLFKEIGL